MENPFSCDDSALRGRTNLVRPTCSVLPSQQNNNQLQWTRSFDPSLLSHVPIDTESKTERKKHQSSNFLRTNTQYHKAFKDISENELLKQSYTCALQKDILYQGRLFVSDNWICFHSKFFGKDTKIAIPVISVSEIKKTKTAILVPNALIIATAQERYVFVSLLSRDTAYKVLMSVCSHLEDKCLGNSPIHSSADGTYTVSPSTIPMNFSADLSYLNAPMVQKRQEIGYSSSSDSPDSPDYENIPEHKRDVYDSEAQRPSLLNGLLMVYLLLICILILSSCFMAFKIISLENRLNSIGSMAQNGDEYNRIFFEDTSQMYSVVSINLEKLEKIQRGLQRLLELNQ